MPKEPSPIYKILQTSYPVFQTLQQQALEQRQLLVIAQAACPKALAKLLAGCTHKNGKLTLLTESTAAASQLRFYTPGIAAKLKSRSIDDIKTIGVRVIRPLRKESPIPTAQSIPSTETIQILRESMNSSPHSDLKGAIQRLAATMEKSRHR
jgi:hypothetical protein